MNFFKRESNAQSNSFDVSEWQTIRTRYASSIAPNVELATTKQQLVVTCASVIYRMWHGNGGLGWDESCEVDFISPLEEHLVADTTILQKERDEISKNLSRIVKVGRENIAIEKRGVEDSQLCSDIAAVNNLTAAIVRWCRQHPTDIPLGNDDEYHGHD